MRLGDLDEVKKRMGEFWFGDPAVELFVDDLVDGTPTIDAVPVVRCKDCKHRRFTGVAPFMYHCCGHNDGLVGKVADDDFCSYGERKDGEG